MAIVERIIAATILLYFLLLRFSETLLGHCDFSEKSLRFVTTLGRLGKYFDFLDFRLTEYTHFFWSISEPRMFKHLLDTGPLIKIFAEHNFDEMSSFS